MITHKNYDKNEENSLITKRNIIIWISQISPSLNCTGLTPFSSFLKNEIKTPGYKLEMRSWNKTKIIQRFSSKILKKFPVNTSVYLTNVGRTIQFQK